MRNYNSKTHVKPLTQNAFRKSDRKYPQPQKLQANQQNGIKQMISQRKQQNRSSDLLKFGPTSCSTGCFPIGPYRQNYFLLLQNPFPIVDRKSSISTDDPYCLWFKNIQLPPTNGRLYIEFKTTEYIIGNWTQDLYPHVVFVTLDGVRGYMDENGKSTNRVIAMKLREIQPAINTDNLTVFELRYSSTSDTCWQLPSDMTHLRIGVKIDSIDQQLVLPLPNPIVLQFQIKDK